MNKLKKILISTLIGLPILSAFIAMLVGALMESPACILLSLGLSLVALLVIYSMNFIYKVIK